RVNTPMVTSIVSFVSFTAGGVRPLMLSCAKYIVREKRRSLITRARLLQKSLNLIEEHLELVQKFYPDQTKAREYLLQQPIPVDKEYLVAITFLEPIKKDQSRLVEFAGMLNDDDVEAIAKIVAERPKLLYGRSSEA
ncbi:MAG: hypothetical protein AB1774_10420, partial [Bacillota bacterium]